ncbi:MAG: serine/threonine-protein phosphatase [Lentisphaeria bacterium]|nr:serine/threonine-protein phosphatase [Lentisphaeria bacterium]
MVFSETEQGAACPAVPPFRVAGETDVGLKRRRNEDSFCCVHSPSGRKLLAAVADGIGGNGRGDIASYICCSELAGAFLRQESRLATPADAAVFLADTLKRINAQIWQRNSIGRYVRPMGTTVNCAVFLPDGFAMANAGDSRLYECLPGAALRIISCDHSFENIRCTLGVDGRCLPPDNAIYRAVGVRKNFEFELATFPRVPGARYFFCSDGLYRSLADDRIQEVLRGAETPRSALNVFMRTAFLAGGLDNITGIVVFIGGDVP